MQMHGVFVVLVTETFPGGISRHWLRITSSDSCIPRAYCNKRYWILPFWNILELWPDLRLHSGVLGFGCVLCENATFSIAYGNSRLVEIVGVWVWRLMVGDVLTWRSRIIEVWVWDRLGCFLTRCVGIWCHVNNVVLWVQLIGIISSVLWFF